MSPAAFGALTLRCVRLVSPEAPGRRKMEPTGTPCSWERSLWAAVYISDPIIAICHNIHAHAESTQFFPRTVKL